jgi:short-subunit dehydrogenase
VEITEATTRKVIDVDLLGLVFGTQVALRGMNEQGFGQIYNMEGFGSDGAVRPGMSVYGAAKRAVRYYTRTVVKETKGTPVKVGTLSPGIVITDFITDMYRDDPTGYEKSKKIFNILGDKVETVTPWLANKVLQNDRAGASFKWLTPGKAFSRFLTAGFRRRDLFALESSAQ